MKVLTFGEIMLRLNPEAYFRLVQAESFRINFAGSEATVAANLSYWGFDSKFFTCLPKNAIGMLCNQKLRQFGIDLEDIIYKNDERMGLIYVEKGANQRASKVIYDRKNSAIHSLDFSKLDLGSIFKDVSHFHISGITPALSLHLSELTKGLCNYANKKNIKLSLDLNYRSNLWNYTKDPISIMSEIVELVDVLIGNEEDIQKLLGIGQLDTDLKQVDFNSIIEETFRKFKNISIIALSQRDSLSATNNVWSGIIADSKSIIKSSKYSIPYIIDRIGAGDSFSSGIIAGLDLFSNLSDVLNFAVSASCLKHSIEGDFCMVSKEEIEKFMSGAVSGRIDR